MELSHMMLGKKAAKFDPRAFQLRDFLELMQPPAQANWYKHLTSFGMMLNNTKGCCTIAAVGHAEQVATLNTPTGMETPPDSAILSVYERACGYVPNDPSTDQGGVIVDVLNWVRQHPLALGCGKPTLFAYAAPNPGDIIHAKQAIAEFGLLDIGIQLPISAQSQVGKVWDVVGNPDTDPDSKPGSWGGHSVIVCAYDENTVTCITWGQLQVMTWRFWQKYVDESHALLMDAWMNRFGPISKVQLAAMQNRLNALNN
jgi:hypothetical protein